MKNLDIGLHIDDVTELHPYTFRHLSALEILGIRAWILYFCPDTFKHNIALKILSVRGLETFSSDDNGRKVRENLQISKLHPDTFKYNFALESLDLHGNNMTHLHRDTFKHNRALRHVKLYWNEIKKIRLNTFKNNSALETIQIFWNPIGCAPGVSENVRIDELFPIWCARTPRCPENCSRITYYDDTSKECLPCPSGTYN